jgi:Flp pilus assembly protein CpaB
MDAVTQRRPTSQGLKRFLGTRKGAWVIAGVCATLGALVLLVYLNSYKSSVNEGLASTPVLTADRLIPKGTAGSVVITEKLFKPGAVANDDVKLGAVSDAQALAGKVATRDILPGQQITATDFAAEADPIRSRIVQTDRAVYIPISGAPGLQGTLRAGDRVDILVMLAGNGNASAGGAQAGARYLMRNVRVMAVGSANTVLQVSDREAAQLAFASENAKLWFVLRPPVGATESKSEPVTSSTLLLNAKPIEVNPDFNEPDPSTSATTDQGTTP